LNSPDAPIVPIGFTDPKTRFEQIALAMPQVDEPGVQLLPFSKVKCFEDHKDFSVFSCPPRASKDQT
jgi:hypothetical protein